MSTTLAAVEVPTGELHRMTMDDLIGSEVYDRTLTGRGGFDFSQRH
ncbi:hypothetical protein [Glycomyces sp. MUSA5-2]